MLKRIKYLLELIRFSHTIFALPFALLAALMAVGLTHRLTSTHRLASPYHYPTVTNVGGKLVQVPDSIVSRFVPFLLESENSRGLPDAWGIIFLGIILCMVFARSAAMSFNRIVDWRLDAKNPRTEKRHIPAGMLSVTSVLAFFIVSAIAFVASTLLFVPNFLPLYLSLPVLAFLCGYSYAKRFTALAHFWLGAALMFGSVCAWIAVRGEVVTQNPADLLPAVILGGAVMLWVAGFDIIYACQDVEFDRKAGLHSVPAKLGVPNSLRLSAACHLGMILLLIVLPWFYPLFGWIYSTGIAAVALLLIYEHWLVRPDDLTRVNVAFFNVNAVVSLGLLMIGTLDLLT